MSAAATENTTLQRFGRLRTVLGALSASHSALIGSIGLCLMLALAIFGPMLWPIDPLAMASTKFLAPTLVHPMGTDDLGRDVFARVAYGARISLAIGFLSAMIATAFGCAYGALSGYYGGAVDEAMMRVAEVFQVIPRFLLAIVIVALFGTGLNKIVLIIGVLSWPGTARVIRAQFLVLRGEEFVLSAVMSGAGVLRVIFRHILPNIMSLVIVSAFLQMGSAILVESFLSFLGLGDPSKPSWGLLLQQAQLYLRSAWWMTTFPGIALALTIFSLNLLGDGLSGGKPDLVGS
jgi:peptide/nickel transport system permease protein